MKNKISLAFLVFVSFCFLSITLQASFTREEQEVLHDVNHSNIKSILDKYTKENADILDSSKDKDIVAFIGKTGSGKSTLINYLNDKELKVNGKKIVLNNPSDPTTMKIAAGFESETFAPKFINCQNLMFYDLPGIGDTRGTAISLVNACFIKGVIENARISRLVFVVGQDEITSQRGKSFKELLDIIELLVPHENIADFSSLVVTKRDSEYSKQDLIDELSHIIKPSILYPWIQASRITYMSAPSRGEINQDDRVEIIQIIGDTPSKKINNVNIGVIYDNQEQNKIKDIYTLEIEDIFNRLLNLNIDTNNLSSLDIATLENKKHYFANNFFNDLGLSLDRSPVITLLKSFSEDIYTSCWNEVRKNLHIKIQNISQQIEIEKEKQKCIQAEKDRQAAENARRAEEQKRVYAEAEQRRIQAIADQQRIELENIKKAASSQKLYVEKNMRVYAVEWTQRHKEAQINQENHAREFSKKNTFYSAYWEGYALGQQSELKIAINKIHHLLAEIEKATQILDTTKNIKLCIAEWEQRRKEAQINRRNHAEKFIKNNTTYSAYWEGYALGQHDDLNFLINKMYHLL